MTVRSLNSMHCGKFQTAPHKLLRAVLEYDDYHVVNPTLLTPQNTTIYLCPKNNKEGNWEIRAICRSGKLGLAVTLEVDKYIQSGEVRWEAPPRVEIVSKENQGVGYELTMGLAEVEAYDAALEYWAWEEVPNTSAAPWEHVCHYKRKYLTDTFTYTTN